jgi:acyl-CoA synthetase (AMP-forming)/AMP-acid ligase II
MGRAIPDTEILVVDEDGRPCAPGEVGELVHRGPTVSSGYWGRKDLTDEVLRPHPCPPTGADSGELVCFSGDLVRADEDGYLYFVSRRDAMIKSSGYRISPTEVEAVLMDTGSLRMAAVIGVPDEMLGQAVVAYVVPRDGMAADPAAITAHCAERLPRYMVPQRIEVAGDLPVTATGKVDYPRLRAEAAG